jgi:hypothetical protein
MEEVAICLENPSAKCFVLHLLDFLLCGPVIVPFSHESSGITNTSGLAVPFTDHFE